jgi:hypothetical protein
LTRREVLIGAGVLGAAGVVGGVRYLGLPWDETGGGATPAPGGGQLDHGPAALARPRRLEPLE